MSDKTYLGNEVSSLDVSPQFNVFSGVEIYTGAQDSNGNDIVYRAGNATGRVLRIDNPWGTQIQANMILTTLSGFQYQPYTASGALLDPAAELGDGVTIADTYSGIYKVSRSYSPLMAADIEAPTDEELDHEYEYEPKQNRIFKREIAEAKTQISVNANAITLEASRRETAIANEQAARERGDNAVGARVTELSSELTVTASEIKSTVASATSKYDTTGTTITLYGYGHPSTAYAASANSGKYYLNQQTGDVYQSNGSVWNWIKRLPLITDKLSSSITQNATSIAAKVSKTGGTNQSFGWNLTDSAWTLTSNSNTVFKATSTGIEVSGKITATSGYIGNGSNGFTISASSIYNGMNNIDSASNGIYIGTNGIALGGGMF